MHLYSKRLTIKYFSASTNDLSFNPDGSAVNPAAFQQHIRRDSNMMAQLFQVEYIVDFSEIFLYILSDNAKNVV